MDNATTATTTKRGSQPFKTNFKGMKKIQRVVSLSGKISKNRTITALIMNSDHQKQSTTSRKTSSIVKIRKTNHTEGCH